MCPRVGIGLLWLMIIIHGNPKVMNGIFVSSIAYNTVRLAKLCATDNNGAPYLLNMCRSLRFFLPARYSCSFHILEEKCPS